ncbi:hypothetical protein BJP25_11500 [Actinokineospora bangkokensis]|uniref:Uncharacterized protein n=1 Tax=Actinokineospora bangkokensis TaxID=1193682 RepID=A0A1Q9LRU1_9PSEU|nr:hypothetical protein BJP25_11500 [Actinokineospora bangkokensis]
MDLKFTASESGPIQVSFEPIGTFFVLEPDESIYLRTPIGTLDSLQVVWWTGGIEVWVDHPGDHTVLDENGTELDTL